MCECTENIYFCLSSIKNENNNSTTNKGDNNNSTTDKYDNTEQYENTMNLFD